MSNLCCAVRPSAVVSFICLLPLQLYTIDRFRRTLVTVGYATLNVFVECGTEKQPIADAGVQVCQLFVLVH